MGCSEHESYEHDFVVSDDQWQGDHAITGPNDHCSAPEEKRTITRGERSSDFNDDWIYRCAPGGDAAKAHLMTSIGDTSGYSIGSFSPKQTFNGISEVRWDVNLTDLGNRQFPEVKIIPSNKFNLQNMPCAIDWFPCDTSSHKQLGSVGTSVFNQYTLGNVRGSTFGEDQWGVWINVGDPALESIRTRRTHFLRDNGNGTITFGIEQEDGNPQQQWTLVSN